MHGERHKETSNNKNRSIVKSRTKRREDSCEHDSNSTPEARKEPSEETETDSEDEEGTVESEASGDES